MKKTSTILAVSAVLVLAAGCRQDMHDGPYYERLEKSSFFEDGRASRPPVDGAVARGELRADDHFYTGYVDGQQATTFPVAVDRDFVMRGRERYEIYCSPCHGAVGDGYGAIVSRGFQRPPSYHQDRLRDAPVGHFYNVITNGKGRMYSFNDRIKPKDRWAITAYIRALQLSQSVEAASLPADMRSELSSGGD